MDAEVYRNRKGWFSLNVQAVCDASRCITNVVSRWLGSTHDSRIFRSSVLRDELEQGKYDGVLLVDAGYALRKYLLVPLSTLSTPKSPSEKKYNRSRIRTSARIEQAFGVLKQRFRVFRTPLRTKLDNSVVIIAAVFCLHNYAIRTGQEAVESNYTDESPTASELSSSTTSGRAVRDEVIRGHFSDEPCTSMY